QVLGGPRVDAAESLGPRRRASPSPTAPRAPTRRLTEPATPRRDRRSCVRAPTVAGRCVPRADQRGAFAFLALSAAERLARDLQPRVERGVCRPAIDVALRVTIVALDCLRGVLRRAKDKTFVDGAVSRLRRIDDRLVRLRGCAVPDADQAVGIPRRYSGAKEPVDGRIQLGERGHRTGPPSSISFPHRAQNSP